MHNPFAHRDAVTQQFRLSLAQPLPLAPRLVHHLNGQQLARLIAHDPRLVKSFQDHASVARRLLASGESETLFHVAASGLVHGMALHFYRQAIEWWLNR